MRKNEITVLVSGLLIAGSLLSVPVQAEEKFTITERQETLNKEITAKEKSGELTLKEAESLRNSCHKIDSRISKMKEKNGGKLSYANETSIEKDLNKLSTSIHKKSLDKRVK